MAGSGLESKADDAIGVDGAVADEAFGVAVGWFEPSQAAARPTTATTPTSCVVIRRGSGMP